MSNARLEMKPILALILFSFTILLSNCIGLRYQALPHRTVRTEALNFSAMKFVHELSYNRSDVIDDEYSHQLIIQFLDSSKISNGLKINIDSDSTLIFLEYDFTSPWDLYRHECSYSGSLEVLDYSHDRIVLKEKIWVHDKTDNRHIYFSGKHTYEN